MKAIHKNSKKETKTPVAIAIGVGTSTIAAVLLSAVFAWLIAEQRLPETMIKRAGPIIQIAASLLGCLLATLLAGRMPAIISAITGAIYMVLTVCINILFMDGSLSGVATGLIYIAVGAIVAILISVIGKGKRGRHKRIKLR